MDVKDVQERGGDCDDYRDNKGTRFVINGAMMEKVEQFC